MTSVLRKKKYCLYRLKNRELSLLQLLLGAKLRRVAALLLAAVLRARRQACIAFAADHTVTVRLLREGSEGRVNGPSTQAEHQVQSCLLLDVVVGERAAVLELLAGEDEALLVGRNAASSAERASQTRRNLRRS